MIPGNEDGEKVHWMFLELLSEMRQAKPGDRSDVDRAWAVAITETEKAFAYYFTWVLQATENE